MKTLPPITQKQKDLLVLICRYRFIDRKQLQSFLNHKNPAKVNLWLKDLLTKDYIKQTEATPLEKLHTPAIYYLGINAIRFLKQEGIISRHYSRRFYSESKRSIILRNHCITLADFTCSLLTLARLQQTKLMFLTETDFIEDTDDPLLSFLQILEPDAYYSCNVTGIAQAAFIEVIDEHIPLRVISRRINSYPEASMSSEWADIKADRFPSVILLLSTQKKLLAVQRLIARLKDTDPSHDVRYNLALVTDIKTKALTDNIWITV